MSIRSVTASLLACAVLCAPGWARAGSAGFKHEKSIYADDKEAPLRTPEGVACAENGRFVVADTGNGRLLSFTWKDGTLGGGEPIKLAQVPHPVRVQLDGSGNLFVLDRKVKKIARVDANGGFGGYVALAGAVNADAVLPVSFRVDAPGNFYVLDASARRVLTADPAGKVVREVPLPKGGEFTDLALGAGGTLYALDAVGAAIWSADAKGTAFQPLAKNLKDRMSFPVYLTGDARGRLFVVDQHGNGVVVLGQDGSFQGRELAIGRNDGLLYYPAQLCVTAGGDAIIADRNNDRVQVFSMTR